MILLFAIRHLVVAKKGKCLKLKKDNRLVGVAKKL